MEVTFDGLCWALGLWVIGKGVFRLLQLLSLHLLSRKPDLALKYGKGSWALVTGASYGIGSAFASALAQHGFNLIIVARSSRKLESLAQTLRKRWNIEVETLVMDLAELAVNPSVQDTLTTAVRDKDWSILVNNVSVIQFKEFGNMTSSDIDRMVRVNVYPLVQLTHMFARSPRRQKAVINLSSLTGVIPLPMLVLYSATKAFTKAFSEALASEVGFDVLCLSPVGVTSNMTFNLENVLMDSSEQYVQGGLRELGYRNWSAGNVKQTLLHWVVEMIPRRVCRACFQSVVRVLHIFELEEHDQANIGQISKDS